MESGEHVVDFLETALWIYDFDQGGIVWANRRALALWSAESITDLSTRNMAKEMSASVRQRLHQHREDFTLDPEREISEFWTLYPDGEPFRVRAILRRYAFADERIGMLVEAHKAEQSEPETIRSANALLHTPVMTAFFDGDGVELYGNPAFRDAFGPGRHHFGAEFFDTGVAKIFREKMEESGQYRETVRVRTTEGLRWHVTVAIRCRDAVTGDEGIQMSAVDVTEARHYQEQLIEARDTAEAADRAKSMFLATISHEMRTPLNGVLGMSAVLGTSELDQKQRDMLTLIAKSGTEMLELIENALDLVDLDAHGVELKSELFDVGLLVRSVVEAFKEAATERELSLITDIASLPDKCCIHDAGQIRRVLRQLVSNAVKFTDRGHVAVRALGGGDGTLRFEVADTGPGVPEDMREEIFERFRQLDSTTTRRHGGTGLGLSISRELVRLWGGEIGVGPGRDGGAVFWFTVPGAFVRSALNVDIKTGSDKS